MESMEREQRFRDNELSHKIVGAALKVHTALGPGLLESAYEACLAYELRNSGLPVQTQVALPVVYQEVKLDVGYRIDMLVAEAVIVEIKAIENVTPLHKAQLLSYLRLQKKQLGLLLNFNVTHMRDGIQRIVNSF